MLLKLSARIADCLTRAQIARERAAKAADPIIKDDYLDIEETWLRLAESYKTVERVEDFISQASQWRHGLNLPSDAEIERLAERMVGDTKGRL